MIDIFEYETGYLVQFNGEPQELPTFINLMTNLMKETRYVHAENGWAIPNLDELSQFFDLGFGEEESDTYDDIGQHLKYQPYIYQREAVQFCLDTRDALLVLPCGAGRI